MKVQITYNGKTIDVELTSEQAQKLGLRDSKKTGWERVKKGDNYWVINVNGYVMPYHESNDKRDTECAMYGNYFSDNALAQLMAKAVGLYLRMRRWADEHNTNECIEDKYEIGYASGKYWDTFHLSENYFPFGIYFSSEAIAEQALKKFKPELEEIFVNGLWHLGDDNND